MRSLQSEARQKPLVRACLPLKSSFASCFNLSASSVLASLALALAPLGPFSACSMLATPSCAHRA
jgi:hypothetical protein